LARLTLGPWTIDPIRLEAKSGDQVVALSTNEVLLLSHLHGAAAPVSRDELLHEVFGYARTAKSRAVDMALQRLRGKLEPDPATPRWICTRRGVGVWLEQASPHTATLEVPTLRFGTPYVPREELETAALGLLRTGWRVVTLVGPGGAGKTRLAVEVSRQVPSEVVVVPLGGCSDGSAMEARIAAALGANDLPSARRGLVARSALCVLDEAETLAEAAGSLVSTWTDVRFLVTSRLALRVADEAVVEVGGLSGEAAEAFFRTRLDASRWNRAAGPEPRARVLGHLDGLPLAIELAASYPDGLEALADLLERGKSPDRAPWLDEALQRSVDLLDGPALETLCALSLWDGPLRRDDVADWLSEAHAQGLQQLAELSLVERQGGGWLLLRTVAVYVGQLDRDWGALRSGLGAWLARRTIDLEVLCRTHPAEAVASWAVIASTVRDQLPFLPKETLPIAVRAGARLADLLGPPASVAALVRGGLHHCPDDPLADVLRCLLPAHRGDVPRLVRGLTHERLDVQQLAMELLIGVDRSVPTSEQVATLLARADNDHDRLMARKWAVEVELFHQNTGFDRLEAVTFEAATYPVLQWSAVMALADAHYQQGNLQLALALFDRGRQLVQQVGSDRLALIVDSKRAHVLGQLDARRGIQEHLAVGERRARLGESTALSDCAAGLLCYGTHDLPQGEDLLFRSLQGTLPPRARMVTLRVLAACRLRTGAPGAAAELLAVTPDDYDLPDLGGRPLGPAFAAWAHGEVALHEATAATQARAVVERCDVHLHADVRPLLAALLRGLRQRAEDRSTATTP